MTKVCAMCKNEKNVSDFHTKKKKNKIQLQPYCKDCNKKYHKEHYNKNKKTYIIKAKNYGKQNQKKLLEFLQDKECKDCGIKDYRVFEFDHLSDKIGNIATLVKKWCWESLLIEIKKCEIVCCNCHRIRTLTRAKSYKILAHSSIGRT